MGQAKQRGTLEERKAQAIVEGRTPGWRAREREKNKAFIEELNYFTDKFLDFYAKPCRIAVTTNFNRKGETHGRENTCRI